mgnify:FL=1|jgi:glycosyltransferase involved in cell wall biosynthesis
MIHSDTKGGKAMISVVIPVYNEEKGIVHNVNEIIKCLPEDYEVVLVDDGSKDSTWQEIAELFNENPRVVGVRFSRNFGKEAAVMAGISTAKGDAVIVMDSDLQHPPEYIPGMIEKWQEGYKIVEAVKKSRGKESFLYKISTGLFYKTLKKMSGLDMANSSDYKLLDRTVVDKIKEFKEGQLFFRGLVDWVGYERYVLKIDVRERKIGKSKFKFKSLFKLALNAITSFSSSLLYITAFLGGLFFISALILGIQTIYNKVVGISASGFTTVILLQLIIGSLVMFCLAIIGIYIGKIYEEVKRRPQYIISEIKRKD